MAKVNFTQQDITAETYLLTSRGVMVRLSNFSNVACPEVRSRRGDFGNLADSQVRCRFQRRPANPANHRQAISTCQRIIYLTGADRAIERIPYFLCWLA